MSKTLPHTTPADSAVSRRRLFVGAGATGALAAAAAVLLPLQPAAPIAEATAPAPDQANAGYQLTAHVQRYYQTARV